jgi:hypothetical protein
MPDDAPLSTFYVQFEILDPMRLERLEALVDALAKAKGLAQVQMDARDFEHLVDGEARRWFGRPVEEGGYPFDSLVLNVGDAEYHILGVRRLTKRVGRLEFDPWAGPYGGAETFRALITAFGQRVTEEVT